MSAVLQLCLLASLLDLLPNLVANLLFILSAACISFRFAAAQVEADAVEVDVVDEKDKMSGTVWVLVDTISWRICCLACCLEADCPACLALWPHGGR
jgi:hypothetical protein